MAGFTLSSPAYRDGEPIPQVFTCQGNDVSPPLRWSGAPSGTQAFALVLDDPDAPRGTWTHWTVWDLPGHVQEIPEGADVERLGAAEGRTSIGMPGYHGPCPPSGRHRYVATLYALAGPLGLPPGADVAALRAALKGRTLGEARLMGTYQKV